MEHRRAALGLKEREEKVTKREAEAEESRAAAEASVAKRKVREMRLDGRTACLLCQGLKEVEGLCLSDGAVHERGAGQSELQSDEERLRSTKEELFKKEVEVNSMRQKLQQDIATAREAAEALRAEREDLGERSRTVKEREESINSYRVGAAGAQ